MKLSTKGRYATRAMLDLALHYGQGPVLLREIARRQQISERYLEHVIIPLRAAGLVTSARGAHGGFALAKPPSEIRLSEIIRVVEGSIALVDCVEDPKLCSRADFCVARDVWAEMGRAMSAVLEYTTLEDLVQRQKEKGQPEAVMYHI